MIHAYGEQRLRIAPVAHKEFRVNASEELGIEGSAVEARFALFEPMDFGSKPADRKWDVLRLLFLPKQQDGGVPAVIPSEVGAYVARRRDGGEVVMFTINKNPNYGLDVPGGEAIVDGERRLAERVRRDDSPYVVALMTDVQISQMSDEIELAARAHSGGSPVEY